jgi:general secretion pathway protein E
MGLDDYLIGSTLLGVVAQRLVRRLCGECRNEPGRSAGCKACQGSGYAGRLAVCEALEITDALKTELRRGVTASQVKSAALAAGFEPMSADGEAKIHAGLIDRAELIRVLGHDGSAA